MNYSNIEKIDASGMHKIYDIWPRLARESYYANFDTLDFPNITHIVFCGMGGSGAIGDLFFSMLSKTSIHVTVVKGYLLPNTIDSNTLVVVISASGNTDESLVVLKSAKKSNCHLIAFSSGGKMENFCSENNILYYKIPIHVNPRTSFPTYVYSILKILRNIIPINSELIDESISQMEQTRLNISTENLTSSNQSLSLANWIDQIPIIYYPWGLQATAVRFKNSIQENMKQHAMLEDIVEACHNGIVAWEKKSQVKPILIQGVDDYIKTKERWTLIKEYFEKNHIDFFEISSVSGSILSKIMNLIYVLDFATIYGSVQNNIDPSPVKSIDFVKNNLL